MKTTRTFTLDHELIERLSEEKNQSAIINELLREYYSVSGTEEDELKQSLKEADISIMKANKDKELLEKRMLKIKKKKDDIRKKFSSVPEEVIEDFKQFPKMDLETLKVRFDGIYKHKHFELMWRELSKAWRMWYGK